MKPEYEQYENLEILVLNELVPAEKEKIKEYICD